MLVTNCATGTLAPYVPSAAMPWDRRRVLHLFRRMGFSANHQQIEAALAQSPSALIDTIIDQAISLPPTPAPTWANWDVNDYTDFAQQSQEQLIEWVVGWVRNMITNGFREKLALFWSNHFVTKYEAYGCPSQLYSYHNILQRRALGNFRDFVHEIGTTPAMLVFLNGVQNTNLNPNENYARELYELFTLGRDNGYTQTDIQETARAFTGWNGYVTYCSTISYIPFFHDNGNKTIFGQTGNWGYDDVHNILFAQRADQIAYYICEKLYRYFIHPDEVAEDIVEGLAQTFKDNNWELAPVFRQLFKSEHFFDDYVIGTAVKSPTESLLHFIREGGFETSFLPVEEAMQTVTYLIYGIGQELFNPTDVAGWPGNRSWINGSTLTLRWQAADYALSYLYQYFPAVYADFAKLLSNNSNDPAYVAQVIVDHFLPNGLNTPEEYATATDVFKWEVPENYYLSGAWNLDWETAPAQVALLIRHISRLPEYQLF